MKRDCLLCIALVLTLSFSLASIASAAQSFALEFDAKKDNGEKGTSVIVDHSNSLNLSGELTIEAWIFPTALDSGGGRMMITGKADTWMHAIVNDGSAYQGAVNAAQWGWEGTGKLRLNQWSHVATSFNGRSYNLYVDGKLKDAIKDEAAINTSLSDVYIGWLPQWGEAFTGLIDEVRISSTARYPAGDFDVPEKEFEPDGDTMLLMHLNEGDGKVANDESAFGNIGFIEGAPWRQAKDQPFKSLAVDPGKDKMSTTWGKIKSNYNRNY